ncbi:MAG: hypothetical protein AAFQ67_05205, partial [Pseudomonadota bacterium]
MKRFSGTELASQANIVLKRERPMVGQANTVPAEQRRRERLDVQLRGRVKLDSGFQFDVKVRNFNAWGANIEAPQNLVLP